MKFIIFLSGLALFVPAWAGRASADAIENPAEQPATADPDLQASADALDRLDVGRLMSDRDYAAQILPHVERLAASPAITGEIRDHLEGIRLIALAKLERRDEVGATVDRILASRPREPRAYAGPLFATLTLDDFARTVTMVETASRNVPGVAWGEMRELFDAQTMGSLLYRLKEQHQSALRVRLAEALFRIGWPGSSEFASADTLRWILLEDRLERGDRTAAAEIAAGISTTDAIVPMIVQPRYDGVLAPGRDRLEVLRNALAEQDRSSAEALAAAPDNSRNVLARVHFLRAVGRDADAMALLRPFADDVPAAAASEEGMWLVNEAAYALLALGRNDEAEGLMGRLVALPMAEHPQLISMSINYAELLGTLGRHADALAYATRLQNDHADLASDYGEMWIASAIACSLAALDRGPEAAPQIARLRAQTGANPTALMQAYLCLGDMPAAEALMVERLRGEDPTSAILALQDYELSHGPDQAGCLYDRLAELRERPAIRAELARVGRVLSMPLTRSYWGNF